ncbi:MAG TPA: neutral/alkaline non-lysosomal ceramidase N-terminal domain-containing protein [Candidatus Binatia bacterium]|nr:neutral/alkaline non-lysosomal ceramidase N-terminal domain-containing protein [Candidatus Binatia bacterium]
MRSPALLAAGLVLLAACSEKIEGTIPVPAAPVPAGTFRAGAAKVDLTPPPGFPMGGFSIVGRTARGWWTRLHARAVYLEDADGAPLALVACDLWAVPAGLVDRVAELLGADGETRHVGRDRLVVAATHTHHSPGNFSSSRLYNAYASPRAGFDRDLFEFLARRIAAAVREAARRRRPATVRLATLRLAGVARNRSFDAFALDPERDALLAENAALPVAPAPGWDADAYRAVDPTLTVLRVDAVGRLGATIAVAAFFAVHATAMGPASEVYSSDLFGVATRLVEERLAGSVVALFNGAEGDVSPDWLVQDRRSALAVGRRLADGIARGMAEAGPPAESRLEAAFDPAVALAGATFTDARGVAHRTAADARMGAAAVGGAEDGRTALFAAGWREGVRGERTPGHGPKQNLLDPWGLELRPPMAGLLRWLASPPEGPRTVPLGVYRMGGLVLATLPGEFTTVLGRRIARGVAEAAGGAPRVVLVGLAGEYRSYFTTPEEYDAQDYEGGSTLYGPESGPLVAHALARLASTLAAPAPAPAPRRFAYDAGRARRFTVDDAGEAPSLPDAGLADVLEDPATGRPVRTFPCFTWDDVEPIWSAERVTPTAGIEARGPRGEWAALAAGGVEESDEGLDFVTVALDRASGGRRRWAVFWMPPDRLPPDAKVRFRVWALDGSTRRSPPFDPNDGRVAGDCLAADAP